MKKGLIIIGLALLSLGAMAQGKVITKYFDQLEDNEN